MEEYPQLLYILILLLLSGIFSGLNLSLMGLDIADLEVEERLGNDYAKKILPLRRMGNLLLCTLLLGNVLVNTVLSVFLGEIMIGLFAVILGTALITIFGEIVPQSVFSRYALQIGYYTRGLVYFFVVFLYPISKPLSVALDWFLGNEIPRVYSKHKLQHLIEYHEDSPLSSINASEEMILKGGLTFSDKKVSEVMTPRVDVFALDGDNYFTKELLDHIQNENSYSRIPVYENDKDNVVGLLYMKDLVGFDYTKKIKIRDLIRSKVQYISYDTKLDTALRMFKKVRIHLFIVKDEHGGMDGIVTLEDIIEEIVGEVIDEYDDEVY